MGDKTPPTPLKHRAIRLMKCSRSHNTAADYGVVVLIFDLLPLRFPLIKQIAQGRMEEGTEPGNHSIQMNSKHENNNKK